MFNQFAEHRRHPPPAAAAGAAAGAAAAAAPVQEFSVQGNVRRVNGDAVARTCIRAFDVDLRHQECLGETNTNQQGHYKICYSSSQFRRAEKGTADIRVIALGQDRQTLTKSAIQFNAPKDAVIDLVIGGDAVRGKSEYDELLNSITPVLDGVSPENLQEEGELQDLTFLVGETGVDRDHLELLVAAFKLAKSQNMSPVIFYGLFRLGESTDIVNLLQQSRDVLTAALKSAVEQNIIFLTDADLSAAIDQLVQLAVAASAGTSKGPIPPSKVGQVLSKTLPSAVPVMDAFSKAQSTEGFWSDLASRPDTQSHLDSIKLSVQLGTLTLNHAPLVQIFLEKQKSGEIKSFSNLAKLGQTDWLKIIQQPSVGVPPEIVGDSEEERVRLYATAMSNIMEDALPTPFFMNRLSDQDDNTKLPGETGKSDVLTFLNRNPSFDIKGLRVAEFVTKPENKDALKDLKNPDMLLTNIASIQRLSNITPRFQQISPLISGGITSALHITRMGSTSFALTYGTALGGDREAQQIFDRAEYVHSMAFNLLVSFGAGSTKFHVPVLQNPGLTLAQAPPAGIPDWSTLFGSMDMCSCDGCHAMDSPAAYLVDLLHFLKDRTQKGVEGNVYNAKDILLQRRRDIETIELSCENTNTPLPYIDLAIEILENAISPPPPFNPFDVPNNLIQALNNSKLDSLKDLFTPPLSQFATSSVIKPDEQWRIDDVAYSYNIELVKTGDPLKITSRSLQTSGTAAERAALPQYVNLNAYEVLGRQVYPMTLPFSLPWETSRTYLQYLGVDRAELMRSFQQPELQSKPLDPAISAEALGISAAEAKIIKGILPRVGDGLLPIWTLWGFSESNLSPSHSIQDPADKLHPINGGLWSGVLVGRVDVFLRQGELQYTDLLSLLELASTFDTEFTPGITNREGAPPDTCALDQLRIVGVGEGQLFDFIRFIRLWKRLQWSMLDLAKTFRALDKRPADIDDRLFVDLANIHSLSQLLSCPIGTVLSFFNDLETTIYIDHSNTDESTVVVSEYDMVFNNSTVISQPSLKLAPGATSVAGSFADHATSITAALNISTDDLSLLLGDAGILAPTGQLSVRNLSILFRHTVLAQSLQVSMSNYLSLIKLIAKDPFADTNTTVKFVERSKKLLTSRFEIEELNYLLRHSFVPLSPVVLPDATISGILDDLRSRLQKITADNTFQQSMANEKGDSLKKTLALLAWDNDVIVQTISTLNGTATYSVLLDAAPDQNVIFPGASDPNYVVSKELQSKFTYDPNTRQLSFLGVMTDDEKSTLTSSAAALPNEVNAKIEALYDLPRNFFSRNLSSFSIASYTTSLATFPSDVSIPLTLRRQFYYDPAQELLHMEGAMTTAQRDALLDVAPESPDHHDYREAVLSLYAMPDTRIPASNDTFITEADVSKLFNSAVDGTEKITPQYRFAYVLKKLLPYLQMTLTDQAITQVMIENLSLQSSTINFLLDQVPPSATVTLRSFFRSSSFVDSAAKISTTRALFKDLFNAFELLYKIATIVSRFKFSLRQLKWIVLFRKLPNDPTVGWLDLTALPLQFNDDGETLFVAWERLHELVLLRDAIPGGEITLDGIFNEARSAAPTDKTLLKPLEDLQTFTESDLTYLFGDNGFKLKVPDAFKDEVALTALLNCLALIRTIGCSAPDAQLLAETEPDDQVARIAVQAVKSKYDQPTWESIARPLRNILREKQRQALVDYLLSNQSTQGTWFHDSNDLFSYYLIDVEMGPCQLTSRIKQATGSIQLFTQRCLMNLEKLVKADTEADPRWLEWKWMKQQNVHGANYRVLLNPENYMQSELRDDQTDLFKALRNTLQQTDITNDTVTDALNTYLRSLDEMARLQMVGLYHEQEAFDGSGLPAIDVIHVVARSRTYRPVYYYRQRVDSISWKGGWMKIEADIDGEHVLPVVWNRKLFIFWATFTWKQDPSNVVMPKPGDAVQGNPGYIEIGLSWCMLNREKFSAKYTSQNTFNWNGASSISDKSRLVLKSSVASDGGELQVVVMKLNRPSTVGSFTFNSANGTPLASKWRSKAPYKFYMHPGTSMQNMMLVEDGSNNHVLALNGGLIPATVLKSTPGRAYELVTSSQDRTYLSQRPLFFQHDERAFSLEPQPVRFYPPWIPIPNLLHPGWMDGRIFGKYIDVLKPLIPERNDPYPPPVVSGPLRFKPSIAWNQGDAIQLDDMGVPLDATDVAIRPQTRLLSAPSNTSWTLPLSSAVISAANRIPTSSPIYLTMNFKFTLAYHPFVKKFMSELNRNGIDGLMQRQLQLQGEDKDTFVDYYAANTGSVVKDEMGKYAEEVVDFEDGLYSVYNWELFFHIPLMIADRLSKNQQFEDSQRWFHYIFDPTDTSKFESPRRFWKTKKFFETTAPQYASQVLPALFRFLASNHDPTEEAKLKPEELTALRNFERGVDQWRKNPFNPFLVARLRTTAFQRMVVMKYLDNLIAWGDNLFRANTIEKINEATQVYILAAEILGERPHEIPPRAIPKMRTFKTIEPLLDSVSNALVPIEQFVPPSVYSGTLPSSDPPQAVRPSMLFFCIPKNDQMLAYWDTVADRLFKIRHCMNLQGIVQQLPLFDPPINPALLVQAAASGVDISSALSDMDAPLPHYRFSYMLQRAIDMANEVKALGSALLAAIEKKDAEGLSLLRVKHEMSMNDLAKLIKAQQADEAAKNAEALGLGKATVQARYDHYAGLSFMNEWEATSMGLESGILLGLAIEVVMLGLAGTLFMIPEFKAGCPTTIGAQIGGSNFGKALRLYAGVMSKSSQLIKQASAMATTLGSYNRRKEDWELQKTLATSEMKQMDSQIAAANIRSAIAQQEIKNHDKMTQNSSEVNDYMRSKFSNQDLYEWTQGQISTLYFNSFQLAHDIAKRAQRAYCNELGVENADFIQFGYWDSLKKGLLAGERLHSDLKRMEMSYIEQDAREYEITNSFSLAQLDPLALMQLREQQDAFFTIPEAAFDMKYPGHYMRRIKSVSITIPCVVGPYTTVNATLSLLKSTVRVSSLLTGSNYARTATDIRFRDSFGQLQSIVTSSGQNDPGLFEVNLRDERTLPFERSGAISTWRIQLPSAFRQFDYRAMTDVIIHMRYTAREGGDQLQSKVQSELKDKILSTIALAESQHGLARLLSLRHEPNGLYHLIAQQTSAGGASPAEVNIDLTNERFPFVFRDATITIDRAQLFVFVNAGYEETYNATSMQFWIKDGPARVPPPEGGEQDGAALSLAPWGRGLRASNDFKKPAGIWRVKAKLADGSKMSAAAFDDIILVCYYSVKYPSTQ